MEGRIIGMYLGNAVSPSQTRQCKYSPNAKSSGSYIAQLWLSPCSLVSCIGNLLVYLDGRNMRVCLIPLVIGAALSVSTLQAETASSLTLRQALALALKQSPELAAFSWDVRSADARVLQARLWPNPELNTQTEDIGGTKQSSGLTRSQTTLQFSQLIELGGKRRARVQEAGVSRELAQLDYQSKRLDVLRKTTQAFVDVLAAQQRVRLDQENVDLVSRLLPDIQKRIAAGRASAIEQTRIDVAVASARIELDQAKRTLLASRQHLSAQWGSTVPDFDHCAGSLEPVRALPELTHLSTDLLQTPDVARWQPEREKRAATLRLQQAEAVPNLTLSAGPRYIEETHEWTQVVGFSLPLPFWNRNQGAILDAQNQLAKVEDEKRAAVARVSTELSDAYQTVARAANEVSILKASVLPGAEKTVTELQGGYEAGRFSYLDINEARRTLTAARLQYLQALADYHKGVADIEALTSRPFSSNRDTSK
jgi:outer membrane protein, heavy metal efflux system